MDSPVRDVIVPTAGVHQTGSTPTSSRPRPTIGREPPVASATTSSVTTSSAFTLNPLDQVIAEIRSDAGTATSWTKTNYDPAGNATDRCVWNTNPGSEACKAVGGSYTTAPAVNTTTAYDARDNRVSLKVPGIGETTYDPAHNYAVDKIHTPTKLDGSSHVVAEHLTDYGYDSRHRLTSIDASVCPVTADTHTCTSTAVATASDTYVYDDNDNRTSVAESKDGGSAVTVTYCYDALNRLTAAKLTTTCATSPTETYAYDSAGSLTQAGTSSSLLEFGRRPIVSCAHGQRVMPRRQVQLGDQV